MPVQRWTCEPCRVRRVKCDLRTNQTACSNCVKRDVKCPGSDVAPPRKPRSGAVVDKVIRQYGSASTTSSPIPDYSPSHTPAPTPSQTSAQTPGQIPDPTSTAAQSPYQNDYGAMVMHQAEVQLVSAELRGEVSLEMIKCFADSHGYMLEVTIPQLYLTRFAQRGKRFENLDPVGEVMARCFVAMGSRSTTHPAVVGTSADMSVPLSYGLAREKACRELCMLAVNRFESLGLWRNATLETVQLCIVVFMVARSISLEMGRPFAVACVNLARDLLDSGTLSPAEQEQFHTSIGPGLLLVDSMSSMGTGHRPTITERDLEDWPALRAVLERPLEVAVTHEETMLNLNASTYTLLRLFSSELHYPLRVRQAFSSSALDRMQTSLKELARVVDVYFARCQADCLSLPLTSLLRTEAITRLLDVSLVALVTIYLEHSIYTLMGKYLDLSTHAEGMIACLESLRRARLSLKRLASIVHVLQETLQGAQRCHQMTRTFVMLESTPQWTLLLSPSGSDDPSDLTADERQWVTDGVYQAGYSAAYAHERWLATLEAQGLLISPESETESESSLLFPWPIL